MRTRQRLDINRLQDLQRLLVMPFLHLQNALHKMHFIRESGVGIGLQVRFQVALQQLIPPVESLGEGIIALLHLRRLSK